MRILLAEDNLMFSSRMASALRKSDHEVAIFAAGEPPPMAFDVVILNLGARGFDMEKVAAAAKEGAALLVGHAGGSEREKLAEGKRLGCDKLVRNSVAMSDIVSVVEELCRR